MTERIVYALVAGAAVVAALFAFLPPARHFIWLFIFWGIVTVSVIAVVGVIVNIVSAMFSMYNGYSPTDEADRPAEAPREALPFPRAEAAGDLILQQRLDDLSQLHRTERALSSLEGSHIFVALSEFQKREYHQVLADVRARIREMSKETSSTKVAS
jgi:hypothetical protein